MKRKSLIYMASLLILAGCDYNDKYFDGLDESTKPVDVKTIEYTLLDEDYTTISKNETNIDLAETAGVAVELKNLSTTKRFSETLSASVYAPAFIADKWYTADEGSSVKLAYNNLVNLPKFVQDLNTATIYKISAVEYESVWGEGSTINFFTPLTSALSNVPKILLSAVPNAEDGDIVAVDYNESVDEPAGVNVFVDENFESTTAYDVIDLEGWNNVTTIGSKQWESRSYNNLYANASAYGTGGELEIYLIAPQVEVSGSVTLSFSACHYRWMAEGGRLSVLVSSDLQGFTPADINTANWDDITDKFNIPEGNIGDAGSYDLKEKFDGKKVYIAFRYYGNDTTGATTTAQIDNINVKSEPESGSGDTYIATNGLFQFNGTAWAAYSENAYMIKLADFQSMGQRYDNFSATLNPDNYLPAFLKLKYPYAQVDDQIGVAYKYYDSGATTVIADEYIYSGTEWIKSNTEVVTDQFVLSNGKWNYDPSVVITLKPGRNVAESIMYFQAIVEYVRDNIESGTSYYQSGYSNAEYYYGSSYYQNNFDFRTSAWRTGHSNGAKYADLSDSELDALMRERLKEAFIPALKANHSDLLPVSGIDVICTIYFGIYTGAIISTPNSVIKFKVTAQGEFEYIEDSFKDL